MKFTKITKLTIVLLLLLPISSSGYSRYESSEFINTTSAAFTLNLEEGFYSIVFDNTGYIGDANSQIVTVSFEISFYDNPSVDPLIDSVLVNGNDYNYYTWHFTSTFSTEQIGFSFTSTGRVSLFVAPDNERNAFENEVDQYLDNFQITTNPQTRTTTQSTGGDPAPIFVFAGVALLIAIAGAAVYAYDKDQKAKARLPVCRNCGHRLTGPFCTNCGFRQ